MANALTVTGLTKSYQDFVLDHVSFTVPYGSIVGLIGENGAGKSTTLNAVLGLIQSTSHFCGLFFYLVPDCGKSVSEEGYYLMHIESGLNWQAGR